MRSGLVGVRTVGIERLDIATSSLYVRGGGRCGGVVKKGVRGVDTARTDTDTDTGALADFLKMKKKTIIVADRSGRRLRSWVSGCRALGALPRGLRWAADKASSKLPACGAAGVAFGRLCALQSLDRGQFPGARSKDAVDAAPIERSPHVQIEARPLLRLFVSRVC